MTRLTSNAAIKNLPWIIILLAASSAAMAAEKTQQACVDLTSVSLSNVTIRAARVVEAGEFDPPSARPNTSRRDLYRDLPAFCRLTITLTPSYDSDINMELWLPVNAWNGKYLAVGNGAFTGNVRHSAMIAPLSRGYATSSTDTGHSGNTASFGLGHPEKVNDFGWRAVHEMAKTSKELVAAFYQQGPQYSYWTGCSAGGRQGMKEAQRFPDDFDGIVAGAPGLDWTGRAAAALRAARFLEANESARLGSDHRELVYQAALKACDSSDGLEDGLISQPQQCNFDPAVLQCNSGDNSALCLSQAQVNTVRMLYASPANPASGRAITGLLPGSEPGWTDLGWTASARASGLDQFRYLVHADSDWKVDQFDFESDIVKAEQIDNDSLNALNPDLQPFFDSGGKLIQYHGWSDPQISPSNTTQYYLRVLDEMGGRSAVHDSYRLFMAPGMGHCARGPGPNQFDSLSALEAWVEQGTAPDSIIAVHRTDDEIDRSRPLCPFPEVATYDGTGSIDEAENFTCKAP